MLWYSRYSHHPPYKKNNIYRGNAFIDRTAQWGKDRPTKGDRACGLAGHKKGALPSALVSIWRILLRQDDLLTSGRRSDHTRKQYYPGTNEHQNHILCGFGAGTQSMNYDCHRESVQRKQSFRVALQIFLAVFPGTNIYIPVYSLDYTPY